MFLSRLCLNIGSPMARRDLIRPYELHRSILKAFPGVADGGPGRVLYRIERQRQDGFVVVLVQSEKNPRWSLASQEPAYFANEPECKPFEPRFIARQELVFCLRANPTFRKQAPLGSQGKRLAILKEEEQAKWFLKKALNSGFMVDDLEQSILEKRPCRNLLINPEGRILISRPREEGSAEVQRQTHHAAWFTGKLCVTDPVVFSKALSSGIGSAKAFGFGLLSVARPGV